MTLLLTYNPPVTLLLTYNPPVTLSGAVEALLHRSTGHDVPRVEPVRKDPEGLRYGVWDDL
jgi:hypothetical protein